MSHCSPVKSTSPAVFKPNAATDGKYEAAKHLPYPQIVDSLLYAAVITRPDIAHAVSVLSRYLAECNDSHYRAAKHLLRYVWLWMDRRVAGFCKGMQMQTGEMTWILVDRKLVTSLRFTAQQLVTAALSTMDAELQASSDATQHAIWLKF